MSSNTNSATPTNEQTVPQKSEQTPNTPEEKPYTCVSKFFKSYLFYFFLATGTAFSAYLVHRRMKQN
jgi:hypothetical protein